MRLIKYLLLLACASGFANSGYLPENHSVNGGLTIIPIDMKREPLVFFDNKKVAVLPSINPNQWLLVVGIPLDSTRPVQNLTMSQPVKGQIPFQVSEKFYATQYLTIGDKRKVDPYAEDRKRIDDEKEEMARIYSGFSQINPFSQVFKAPALGPVSSLFGLKRVYNHQPQAPHAGLDIAAPANSPIQVVAKGRVVAIRDYFFTGNTVIVDHGMGVFSLYAHLNQITVKEGQNLDQGAQVGNVGQTGRATGPHLHWSMIVNQTLVDPLLFVPYRIITAVAPVAKLKQGK